MMGTLRIAFRVWQVYWVHLGVFFVTLALMLALNATQLFPRDEVGALNLDPVPQQHRPEPDRAADADLCAELLRHPADVSGDPGADPGDDGAGAGRRAAGHRCSALALWVAATAGLNLPGGPLVQQSGRTGQWFFNPFAWQLVFFTGFALMAGWLPAPPVRRWLVGLAVGDRRAVGALRLAQDHRRVRVRARLAPGLVVSCSTRPISACCATSHFLALAYLAWVAAGEGGARLRRGGLARRGHRAGLAGRPAVAGGFRRLDGAGAGARRVPEPRGRRARWRRSSSTSRASPRSSPWRGWPRSSRPSRGRRAARTSRPATADIAPDRAALAHEVPS